MVTRKRIGVLAGGASAEREVSLKSGSAILQALAGLGYDAVMIDPSEGLCEAVKRERIEVAFLALHGGHGENGCVQGLLEVVGIPYTGSGVLASALAMDKEASKKVFLYHGIPVPPFVVISRGDPVTRIPGGSDLPSPGFGMPWVIKPATEGSSIGVSIVKDPGEFREALEKALHYGSRVIVEKHVRGKEIQVGVLGDGVLGGVEVRPSREFYSYEAKYTAGLTQYILPPEIAADSYETLKVLALRAHTALTCRGATRVDLIMDETGQGHVLEVNTIPGMTETSLLPKIAQLAGLSFSDLIEEILRLSIEKTAASS